MERGWNRTWKWWKSASGLFTVLPPDAAVSMKPNDHPPPLVVLSRFAQLLAVGHVCPGKKKQFGLTMKSPDVSFEALQVSECYDILAT